MPDPVVAAIQRVLKVERDGLAALRQGESQAQRTLDDARSEAAAIGRRAGERISRLHAAYLQKLEDEIASVAACGAAPGDSALAACDRTRLLAAARRVAARLTEAT